MAVLSGFGAIVDEGDPYIRFTLRLSSALTTAASVRVYTQGINASSSYDYTTLGYTTITFAAGQTERTIDVPILNNSTLEAIEHFQLFLDTPNGLTIADPVLTATILDNDRVDRAPIATVGDVNVDESAGFAEFVIILDRSATASVTVNYRTVGGTATAGSDFTAATGSVTFSPGEVVKTVRVAITNDSVAEAAESFGFELTGISGVSGAKIGDGMATGTIGLSDTAAAGTPYVSVERMVVNEAEASGQATLVFKLSAPSASETSFRFNTFNGSAGDYDYDGYGTTTIVFAPGETIKTVVVPLLSDNEVEGFQQFGVTLQDAVGLKIADRFTWIPIADDDRTDRAPIATVSDIAVDEGDGFADVVIVLDRASTVPVTVSYRTVGDTATADSDFTTLTGSVVFNPGETAKTVRVAIADDTVAEKAEAFRFELTGIAGVSGGAIGDGVATIAIGLSDTAAEATPYVSVERATFNEVEPDGMATLVFKLSAPSTNETSVDFNTFNQTAGSYDFTGYDYSVLGYSTTTIVFAPGETIKTIKVPIIDDAGIEGTEQFGVALRNAIGLKITDMFTYMSIADNDRSDRPPIATVGDLNVDEGDGFADFVILLDRGSNVPVTVSYRTVAGSAAAGSDFTALTGSVVFNPGETAKTIRVAIADDTSAERAETFQFELTGVSGAAIGDGLATATIGLSDTTIAATPYVTVEPMTVNEASADGLATVVFKLSAPSSSETSVEFYTFNKTAGAYDFEGYDYSVLGYSTTTMVFAPGETVKTVQIPILNDTEVEGMEHFGVALRNAVGLRISDPFTYISIADNDRADRAPIATVADLIVDESDGFADFVIVLDRSATTAVTVDYRTLGGSATSGKDFTAQTGSVVFNPGETTKAIRVAVTDDTSGESAETFSLELSGISGVSGAAIAKQTAVATIARNDGTAVSTPVLSVADVTTSEVSVDGLMTFRLTLSARSVNETSVDFYTSNGTAGSYDYEGYGLTRVYFAPGETVKLVQVPIVRDSTVEAAESFNLNFTNPVGLSLARTSAVGTITDASASTVQIAVATPELSEGNSGPRSFSFVVTRDGDVSAAQSVKWAVAGTGTNKAAAADFVGGVLPSGTISFAANETAKTITVQVLGDTTVESNEKFAVTLSSPSTGLILANTAVIATILNDDTAPAATLAIAATAATRAEGDSGTTPFAFTVTRSGDTSATSSAVWKVTGSGSTAAAATDFVGGTLPGGTVSFAAGQTSATITVNVAGDTVIEGDEGFTVTLSSPTGATITQASATGLIQNDEYNVVNGTSGNDTLAGTSGGDVIYGLAGNDTIDGGAGGDRLFGGAGKDMLTGGAGADRFVYTALSDSTPALAGRDIITDFSRTDGDSIDISAIDARADLAGDQAFTLVTGDFTGTPGEASILRFDTNDVLQLDVDGDGVADMMITVRFTGDLIAADLWL